MSASAAEAFATRVRKHRIIAILRNVPDTALEPLVMALVKGGIRLIEVALSRPSAVAQIERLKALVPQEVSIGAGTVTDVERAEAAQAAGAEYLVTPHVAPAVNAFAGRRGLGLVCGALTPTEISAAREGGSTFVKVFPASVLGPAYFRALQGPYPDADLIAVGGVHEGNLEAYLDAGATAAGVGGALTRVDWASPDFGGVRDHADRLVGIASR